ITEGEIPAMKAALIASPYMVAVCCSISGKLKAAIRISNDPAQHKASFLAARVYIRQLLGKEIDEKCSDPARLWFLSHDPDIWHRSVQEAEILPLLPPPPAKVEPPITTATSTDLDLDDARNIAASLELVILRDFEPHDERQGSWMAFVT